MGMAEQEKASSCSEAVLVVHLNWLRVLILVSLQPATPIGCSGWMEVVLRGAELPSCVSPIGSKLRRADRSASCHYLQRFASLNIKGHSSNNANMALERTW